MIRLSTTDPRVRLLVYRGFAPDGTRRFEPYTVAGMKRSLGNIELALYTASKRGVFPH